MWPQVCSAAFLTLLSALGGKYDNNINEFDGKK